MLASVKETPQVQQQSAAPTCRGARGRACHCRPTQTRGTPNFVGGIGDDDDGFILSLEENTIV
jgi:hypothetical protein